jgi:hypothetical protein
MITIRQVIAKPGLGIDPQYISRQAFPDQLPVRNTGETGTRLLIGPESLCSYLKYASRPTGYLVIAKPAIRSETSMPAAYCSLLFSLKSPLTPINKYVNFHHAMGYRIL